jgi:hypothetical protein
MYVYIWLLVPAPMFLCISVWYPRIYYIYMNICGSKLNWKIWFWYIIATSSAGLLNVITSWIHFIFELSTPNVCMRLQYTLATWKKSSAKPFHKNLRSVNQQYCQNGTHARKKEKLATVLVQIRRKGMVFELKGEQCACHQKVKLKVKYKSVCVWM